jgi:hypothetical protein
MVERLRRHAVVLLEPVGGVLGVGKYVPAFAEHPAVELEEPLPESDVRFGVFEVAVLGAAQFVCGTVLMNDPGNLSRVPAK